MIASITRTTALALACTAFGCGHAPAPGNSPTNPPVQPSAVATLPGHGDLTEDTTPKEGPRMVPPEVYIRTYLNLFGGLAPLAAQTALVGTDHTGLFDSWDSYLASLGLPNYQLDIPRSNQTNALMVATFERTGLALCDRAMQHDATAAMADRLIFAFDLPTGTTAVSMADFETRFDVLHRTFLGYPAAMAPTDRTTRFYAIYTGIVSRYTASGAPHTAFANAQQLAFANVCYGLVRHPEFHLY